MKLAQGLILRADYKKRLEQLRTRAVQNAQVQEDQEPSEDTNQLIKQYNELSRKMVQLVAAINRANATEQFDDERTIAEALAERDELQRRQSTLRNIIEQAATTQNRYSQSEIKIVPTVDVHSLQKQVDTLAKESRELDMKLQELNWHIDIDYSDT